MCNKFNIEIIQGKLFLNRLRIDMFFKINNQVFRFKALTYYQNKNLKNIKINKKRIHYYLWIHTIRRKKSLKVNFFRKNKRCMFRKSYCEYTQLYY